MKNNYEVIEAGSEISLVDQFGEFHTITVNKKTIVIFANGEFREWQILIDFEDLEKIDKLATGSWYVGVSKGTIYARYCVREKKTRKYILMHRLIMNCDDGMVVDHHPHHYGLDNRRENLTNVTPLENQQNQIYQKRKSGYLK